MHYWGGNGVEDDLHPSLQAYIDCFESPPFPRMFPRGGGVWNQDPILMRDFRIIRAFAVKWKDNQRQLYADVPDHVEHDEDEESGIEAALEAYLGELGQDGTF